MKNAVLRDLIKFTLTRVELKNWLYCIETHNSKIRQIYIELLNKRKLVCIFKIINELDKGG